MNSPQVRRSSNGSPANLAVIGILQQDRRRQRARGSSRNRASPVHTLLKKYISDVQRFRQRISNVSGCSTVERTLKSTSPTPRRWPNADKRLNPEPVRSQAGLNELGKTNPGPEPQTFFRNEPLLHDLPQRFTLRTAGRPPIVHFIDSGRGVGSPRRFVAQRQRQTSAVGSLLRWGICCWPRRGGRRGCRQPEGAGCRLAGVDTSMRWTTQNQSRLDAAKDFGLWLIGQLPPSQIAVPTRRGPATGPSGRGTASNNWRPWPAVDDTV